MFGFALCRLFGFLDFAHHAWTGLVFGFLKQGPSGGAVHGWRAGRMQAPRRYL